MGSTRTIRWMATIGLAALAGAEPAEAQGGGAVHAGKEVFVGWEDWPAVSPGQAPLRNFQPFRAVYERVYRDGAGQRRQDRVIVTAERVMWAAEGAVLVTLVDAGSPDYDDTSARVQARFFAEGDQRLLLQFAPAPGTAKDYLVVHADRGPVRITHVAEASAGGDGQTPPAPLPQFGAPAFWLAAGMDLTEGRTLRFAPADAPAPSNILGARPMVVGGFEEVVLPSGERVRARVVSYPLGMVGPRLMRNYLIDRPPYLVEKRPVDLDAAETTDIGTLRLVEFTVFQR